MWAQNFQRWPPPYMGIIQYSDHLQISPYYIVDHMYDAPKMILSHGMVLRCVTMMFSEFCETTGLHGWKYLAKVKYCVFYWATVNLKLNGKLCRCRLGTVGTTRWAALWFSDWWCFCFSNQALFAQFCIFPYGPLNEHKCNFFPVLDSPTEQSVDWFCTFF